MDTSLAIDGILGQAETLDDRAFEKLYAQISLLKFKRAIPEKERLEKQLLRQINTGLPVETINRFRELQDKLREETITETEHRELLKLLEKLENLNVRRVESLIKLASFQNKPVQQVMKEIGFSRPEHG